MTEPSAPLNTFALLRGKPDDPPNIRRLRYTVIGMGLLLVAGFVTVVLRIVYLVTRNDAPAVVAAPARATLPPLAAGLDLSLALPAGAVVNSHSVSGQVLSVHYTAPSGEEIAVFDLERGQVVRRVVLTRGGK